VVEQITHNELAGLGASVIAVVLILRLVFDFMKSRNGEENEGQIENNKGFTEAHAQCLSKIEYQVNEMHSGLQVNKDLQRALANIMETQEKQTAILESLNALIAQMERSGYG
jgi:ADP-ribosylglycohydrolase